MESINLTPEEEIKFIKWLQYQAFISNGMAEQMRIINLPDTVIRSENVKCAAFSYVARYLENRESVSISTGDLKE